MNVFRYLLLNQVEDLFPGPNIPFLDQPFSGPCIVTQRDSTVLVLPDQEGTVDRAGVIRIRAKDS